MNYFLNIVGVLFTAAFLFAACSPVQPLQPTTQPLPSPPPVNTDASPIPTWTRLPTRESLGTPRPTPELTPNVSVGMSFIGTFLDGNLAYFHIRADDREFKPESLVVLDTASQQVVTGPFRLSEGGSGPCSGKVYQSEGIDLSQLPDGFHEKVSRPPYFTYQVSGKLSTGKQTVVDLFTTMQFICENTPSPLTISLSLIVRESPLEGDLYYLHVNVLDKQADLTPVSIEILDPANQARLSGPFFLGEKDSELCGDVVFETEGIDPSAMPENYWFRYTDEPLYGYRVTLLGAAGESTAWDIVGSPEICKLDME